MDTNRKPNIIFILTDDQGYWAMGCAGNREIQTPNIDRIASQGMRFDNFFCTSPVCSPARASLLTGLMPSQHGIHDWLRKGNLPAVNGIPNFMEDDSSIEYLVGIPGYTDYLAKAGYTCGISGKWHLGDSLHPQKGYSYWNVFPYGGSNHYYNPVMIQNGSVRRVNGYLTDIITQGSLDFIDEQAGQSAPFYLSVHYTAPHSPWESGQHPEEILSRYDECPFHSCPEETLHPWQINSAPRGRGERRRELLKGYFAAVTAMDLGVGQILQRISDKGIAQNTMIIFGSDNGMNMGHHGIWGKGNGTFPLNMFDTSVKVPFIMSLPGVIPQGITNQNLLSHYDVFPTLLDYLRIPFGSNAKLPGRSFASLLRGEKLIENDFIVVYDEYGPVRMIRTKEWKYVHRYPYGPHEFYNLYQDPEERHNIIDQLNIQPKLREMRNELETWFLKYSHPDLDGTRLAVYGKGQSTYVGKRSSGEIPFSEDWYYVDVDGNRLKKE